LILMHLIQVLNNMPLQKNCIVRSKLIHLFLHSPIMDLGMVLAKTLDPQLGFMIRSRKALEALKSQSLDLFW